MSGGANDNDSVVEWVVRPYHSTSGAPRRRIGGGLRVQILHAVENYWWEHRRPPTIREICSAVNVESTGHVAHHVAILVRQGLLTREPGISRGLSLTHPAGLVVQGTIAAGEPIDLFDDGVPELLEFSELAISITANPAPTGARIYALRVRGTSMIDDGILDGDFVLVAPGSTVANGAIAVAIENRANGGHGAATLKRVFVLSDGVRLQPANATFAARFIAAKEWDREWSVRGTVVAVYRRCIV